MGTGKWDISWVNGTFPSSTESHFQSEAKCEAIVMKMIFNYDANKTHFHNKGFALSLVFEVRFFGTRKWPISQTRSSNMGTLPLTRKKRVGYWVEWLRHYHIWEILVAFIKVPGKHVHLPVPIG